MLSSALTVIPAIGTFLSRRAPSPVKLSRAIFTNGITLRLVTQSLSWNTARMSQSQPDGSDGSGARSKGSIILQGVLEQESANIAPSLDAKGNHKGASGKIAVIGGSLEYTGAPYFAAISALKTGADLLHIFCARDAAVPIKSYSPELIVHPLLQLDMLDEIVTWLQRMDVVLIGCGLGRTVETLNLVQQIIRATKKLKKPLILDADALFLIMQHPDLLNGFESHVILTPNRMELARLVGVTNPVAISDEDVMRMIARNKWPVYVTLLVKAANDQVYNKEKKVTFTDLGGSGRRCGGQGDILGGCLAVFLNWSLRKANLADPQFVAAFAACKLTRECNSRTFLTKGRSMTAGDMIEQIHAAFDAHFEIKCNK